MLRMFADVEMNHNLIVRENILMMRIYWKFTRTLEKSEDRPPVII